MAYRDDDAYAPEETADELARPVSEQIGRTSFDRMAGTLRRALAKVPGVAPAGKPIRWTDDREIGDDDPDERTFPQRQQQAADFQRAHLKVQAELRRNALDVKRQETAWAAHRIERAPADVTEFYRFHGWLYDERREHLGRPLNNLEADRLQLIARALWPNFIRGRAVA